LSGLFIDRGSWEHHQAVLLAALLSLLADARL